MSVSSVPEKIRSRLWGKAAGRCQYEGCNKELFYDSLTKVEFNTSYVAHIYADSTNGPRYNPVHSPLLKSDLSNLMLLCDEHHRLIDKEDVNGHSVDRLIEMKKAHEDRIAILTSIIPEKQSHIILFGANIGQHEVPLSYKEASNAILPNRYPSQLNAINLGLSNSVSVDHNDNYWTIQDEQLKEAFQRHVASLKGKHHVQHFSVFALAPIPLLIRLGTLFSDIYDVDVFQRHREPCTWRWQTTTSNCEFTITQPNVFDGEPALKISLSAAISDDRVTSVVSGSHNIWELSVAEPHNDFLKTQSILSDFRVVVRKLLDTIKFKHGQNKLLHVFPAMPVSSAIEFGRVIMPKADLNMLLYDQNNIHKKFTPTINLNYQ